MTGYNSTCLREKNMKFIFLPDTQIAAAAQK